jgi:hypothetical protein
VLFLEETRTDPQVVARLYATLGVDPGFRPTVLGAEVNASRQDKPVLDDGLLARLRAYFRDSDRELARLLGRPLPWDDRPTTTKEDEQ